MADRKWMCPYFGIELILDDCYVCAMVAEEEAPLYYLPREPEDLHEFERVCLACEHHPK